MRHLGTVWATLTPYDPHWHRMSHSGTIWATLAPYELLWHRLSHSGTIWATLAPYEPLWHRMSHSGTIWATLAPFEPPWHRIYEPLAPYEPLWQRMHHSGTVYMSQYDTIWTTLAPHEPLCHRIYINHYVTIWTTMATYAPLWHRIYEPLWHQLSHSAAPCESLWHRIYEPLWHHMSHYGNVCTTLAPLALINHPHNACYQSPIYLWQCSEQYSTCLLFYGAKHFCHGAIEIWTLFAHMARLSHGLTHSCSLTSIYPQVVLVDELEYRTLQQINIRLYYRPIVYVINIARIKFHLGEDFYEIFIYLVEVIIIETSFISSKSIENTDTRCNKHTYSKKNS